MKLAPRLLDLPFLGVCIERHRLPPLDGGVTQQSWISKVNGGPASSKIAAAAVVAAVEAAAYRSTRFRR
jgi:hypothetical protein